MGRGCEPPRERQLSRELTFSLNTAIKLKHCPCKQKRFAVWPLPWEAFDEIFRKALSECGCFSEGILKFYRGTNLITDDE